MNLKNKIFVNVSLSLPRPKVRTAVVTQEERAIDSESTP